MPAEGLSFAEFLLPTNPPNPITITQSCVNKSSEI